MTGKQRAKLRGIANGYETILLVGKNGITDEVTKQADEALTARELIKGKCLENCPIKPREAADIICEKTGADGVQVIGSKFVIYRPNPDEPVIKLPKTRKK